jgi:hypothetical protein
MQKKTIDIMIGGGTAALLFSGAADSGIERIYSSLSPMGGPDREMPGAISETWILTEQAIQGGRNQLILTANSAVCPAIFGW